jgi:cation transport regulator ChaB
VNQRLQYTPPQAILVPVMRAMLYYHLLDLPINVLQFVIQLHQHLVLAILVNALLALHRYQQMLLQTLSPVKELVKQRLQHTPQQVILVRVMQAMLYYHFLDQPINVLQFVIQHHQHLVRLILVNA